VHAPADREQFLARAGGLRTIQRLRHDDIAAEMTARVAHAIEITPAYVDVAVKRWQDFTGQQAVLDGDGRSFDDVAAQRPGSESADAA
jgi:hypothetical protein